MNSKLTFSPMGKIDLAQIMAIEQQIYPNPWSIQVMLDCIEAGYQCVKAVSVDHPDEIACYALLMVGYQETNLLNIGVNPKFQRQSFASQMLHRLLLISRINQAEKMWLEVRESNQAAINLYLKFDFEVVGKRKNYYHYSNEQGEKIVEHAILMSRKVALK